VRAGSPMRGAGEMCRRDVDEVWISRLRGL
jgi:hypothetical protein